MKKEITIYVLIGVSLLLCGGYLYYQKNENEIISSNNNPITVNQISLLSKEVRLKKVGDYFDLKAIVNDDATIQSVSFSCDNNQAITLTKIDYNTVRITKNEDFYGQITITASSDDPFVNLKSTCIVRAYNYVTYLGDLYLEKIYDDSNKIYNKLKAEADQIILKEGLYYKAYLPISTCFGDKKDEYAESDLTFTDVEEIDKDNIINELQNVLGNNIINDSYTVDFRGGDNYLYFTFKCVESYDKTVSFVYEGIKKEISFIKYVPALNINSSSSIII